jgi:uncharacterized protein (TIGR02453 family)
MASPMSAVHRFSGFPPRFFQFFRGLARHNNTSWFEARRHDYATAVLDPARAFVSELAERLRSISPGIRHDLCIDGTGSIMRIQRGQSARSDSAPFKTHLGIIFWEGSGPKTACPGFYIHVDVEAAQVYGGIHTFPKELLVVFRRAVVDEGMGADLMAALAPLATVGGFELGGERLGQVPLGYRPDHPRAHLLRYTGLFARSPNIDAQAIASPQLVELCYRYCEEMGPMHRWLVKMAGC